MCTLPKIGPWTDNPTEGKSTNAEATLSIPSRKPFTLTSEERKLTPEELEMGIHEEWSGLTAATA
jgi:hypothetical protein